MTWDEDVDIVCRALEQPQRGEVVLNRVRGVVQVEKRNQDIRKHVASDENTKRLDQPRRAARGMRLTLDDPDLRPIRGNMRSSGPALVPYLDPYLSCFLCLMRLFVLLGERG